MRPDLRPDAACLIVGGTRGIGLAIAKRLAAPGRTLFLNYRDDDAAAASALDAVSRLGASVHLIRADAGTPEGGERIVEQVRSRRAQTVDDVRPDGARLDGLVHCAGIAGTGLLADMPFTELDRTIAVGGMGLLYVTRPALDLMGEGSAVVYLSGAAVDVASRGGAARGMAKALGECMVRYLALECAPRRINFNTLRVGAVDTGLFRAARAVPDALPPITLDGTRLDVSDVAGVAAFLLSPAAAMIRGQTIRVDGGLSIARS